MLKSNGPNSILKDALRDERSTWFINCIIQEYLVNVGQNSLINTVELSIELNSIFSHSSKYAPNEHD
jgi:hypothetical protein